MLAGSLPKVSSDAPSLSRRSVSNWTIGNMRKGSDGLHACAAPHGAGWYWTAVSSRTRPCAMAYESWLVGKSM